jgi:outer membrane protein assembly factor BamA
LRLIDKQELKYRRFSAVPGFNHFSLRWISTCVLLFGLGISYVSAQTELLKHDSVRLNPSIDSTRQRDIQDVVKKIFSKEPELKITKNVKDSGLVMSVVPAIGYAMVSGYTGVVSSNFSFYTNDDRYKASEIAAHFSYSQNNQYWLGVNSNMYFLGSKLHTVGDWRAYKFPTNTYGLGTNTSLSDADKIDYFYIRAYQVVVWGITPDLFAGLGYHLDYYTGIEEHTTLENTDFQEYGKTSCSHSSGISFNILYDSRRNTINPDQGSYCNLQYRNNFTFLGSDKEWRSFIFDARKYIRFPGRSRNILALWSYNYFTFGKPPYLDLPSTGWDAFNNTGRGYVQGRFRGSKFAYLESEYRFTITRNGLLGGVVFVNEQSLAGIDNKFERIRPGYGFGLRIKVNKRSNTNLSIDYGFGQGGSHGILFNLGEVF